MRFFAVHDIRGNLTAIMVSPPDSPPEGAMMEPGQLMTEVDAPEVTIDLGEPASYERLVEVLEHFEVEVKATTKTSLTVKGKRDIPDSRSKQDNPDNLTA